MATIDDRLRPPAQFPKTEDELDDWSVYADWLQTRGDPLGDLIALDLSLPAAPSDAQLEAFRAAAQRRCREVEVGRSAWCLGYLRKLVCHRSEWDEVEQLAAARELLKAEAAARLEDFEVTLGELHDLMPEYFHDAPCGQLFSALPPSCRRVRLEIADWFEREIAVLLELLPATVRELALDWFDPALLRPMDPAWVLSDRFDVVDVGLTRIDAELGVPFAAALARTRSVRLRVDSTELALPPGRWELGAPGDAALLQPHRRRAVRLARWDALERQYSDGLLPVRAQLAAASPEDHWLEVQRRAIFDRANPGYVALVRRADTWTLVVCDPGEHHVKRNGEPVKQGFPNAVSIEDGDLLELDGIECVFVARDATQRAIEMFAG